MAATDKRGVAFQPKVSSACTNRYFGLSNEIIAKKLFCGKTSACELKREASKNGFIEIRKQYKTIVILEKRDFHLGKYLPEIDRGLIGRIKCRRLRDGRIRVVEQMYDEIIPKVWIKSIGKLKAFKKAA